MVQGIVAQTTTGPVSGRTKEDILLFAGIPYAAPPTGNLRFKAPQPHPPWQQPRQAYKFGPAAPQVPSGGMTDSAPVRWDEDCLTLNVQTPACDDAARPVLVWIHGGGYRTGQSSIPWYNGARFAQHGDIVVVSINYRLGALGFADLSHLGAEYQTSAVNGTLDQIAALTWVRDNIAAFGGDPGRVTIAGESAGGFSVATLLACGAAEGLFSQAIPQSGAAHHTLPAAAAATVTEALFEHLSVDDAMGLEALPAQSILDAQTAAIGQLEKGAGLANTLNTTVAPFYPAHGTELLPVPPIDAIRSGAGSGVRVLTGSNAHETTLWGYGKVDDAKLQRVAETLGAAAALDVYRQTMPGAGAEELLIALTTDHMFRIPAVRLAEARAAHTADTWMYLFAWESRAMQGRLKATHALEIPFAFNNLDRAGVDAFTGPGPTPQHVADNMHSAWTQFIRSGDPGWPRYRPDNRVTMVFNDQSGPQTDPDAATRQAWEGLR